MKRQQNKICPMRSIISQVEFVNAIVKRFRQLKEGETGERVPFSIYELPAGTFTKVKPHLTTFQYHFTGIPSGFVPFVQENFYEETFAYPPAVYLQ